MRATLTEHAVVLPELKTLWKFLSGITPDWLASNGDVGGFYAPRIERGSVTRAGGEVVEFQRLVWPSSTLYVEHDGPEVTVCVDGFRGSAEDCTIPILRECGIDVDSPKWRVRTSRPDVPWYTRAGASVES